MEIAAKSSAKPGESAKRHTGLASEMENELFQKQVKSKLRQMKMKNKTDKMKQEEIKIEGHVTVTHCHMTVT